jgi:hypothetical protein
MSQEPIPVVRVVVDEPRPAEADAFIYFWMGGVVLMMCIGLAWGLNDLKKGSARLSWVGFGRRVSRNEEPFEYWIAVGSKFLVLPVGAFMLWFAYRGFF